jgi:TolB-like protein
MRVSLKLLLPLALVLSLAACAVMDQAPAPTLESNAKWALLPFLNHTETPQAGLRAETITENLLRSLGARNLQRYPATLNKETLLDATESKVVAEAMNWAKQQGVRYALTGNVDEWRYKVGIDGEPAVGITLQLLDVQSGAVVWSGVAAGTGWSRDGLSAVAQKLIKEMLVKAKLPQ